MVDNTNVTNHDEDLLPEEIRVPVVKGLLLTNGAIALLGAALCLIWGPFLAAVGLGSAGLLSVLTVTQDWQL